MPGIYDFGIKPLNLSADFEQGKERARVSGLRALAGDYYAKQDPQLGQIARLGGDAAGMQKDMQGQEDRKRKTLGSYAAILASAAPAQRQQLWARIHPQLAEFGIQAEPEWNDANLPTVQAVARQWGDLSQNSDLPAEARTALFFQAHPELATQEAERYKNRPTYDPSTGAFYYPKGVPTAGGPQMPAPMPSAPPQAPQGGGIVFDDATLQSLMAVPASERATLLKALQADAQGKDFNMSVGSPAELPPQSLPAMGPLGGPAGPGSVQVGPTAGEKAAQVAAAQKAAEYAADQQRADFDVQQAAAVEAGKQNAGLDAKSAAERRAKIAERTQNANTALDLLDEAARLLPDATGSDAGALRDRAGAVIGKSTKGARASAALQTLAGQLVLMQPRMEGPQSDADRLLYKQMAGDLGNERKPNATRMYALRQMQRLQLKYSNLGSKPAAPAAPPSGGGTVIRFDAKGNRIK